MAPQRLADIKRPVARHLLAWQIDHALKRGIWRLHNYLHVYRFGSLSKLLPNEFEMCGQQRHAMVFALALEQAPERVSSPQCNLRTARLEAFSV